jgi:foldase protein PrsA
LKGEKMKNKILILVCCFLSLALTACGNPKLKNGEEVVASVNGKEISADALYKELKVKSGDGTTVLMDMIDTYIAEKEVKTTDTLKKEVEDYVTYYKSYAQQYGVDLVTFLAQYANVVVKDEAEFRELLLMDRKKAEAAKTQMKKSLKDADIEKYYNDNYSEQLTVRHILIKFDEGDAEGTKALKTANDLIAQLKAADKNKIEEKFIDLAKNYSEDATYSNGGLYENFMSSTVVKEFWSASYALKDGEYTTSAVKTEFGYHVIYRKSSKAKPTLESSKEEIKTALVNATIASDASTQTKAWIDIRKSYKLKINDLDLKKVYDDYVASVTEKK